MGKRALLCATAAFLLSGCGIADHYKAQDRMEKSQDAYRNCVATNLNNASKCDALKAIYEADKAAFERR
jgi:hypothetical protein